MSLGDHLTAIKFARFDALLSDMRTVFELPGVEEALQEAIHRHKKKPNSPWIRNTGLLSEQL